ncbi:MAG: YdcF family protein [Anaerolinea sp.]|nr:YdcF family protein [Anaerolinea sp.]
MFFHILFYLTLAALLIFGLPRLITALYAASRTYTVETTPNRQVAIVFGAGLNRDGSPSPVLRDRVFTAAQLYFAGKVEKLLMSGDNRFVYYNEPAAMRAYALQLGVPEQDIVLDYAGRRTYDTCYRAQAIFGINQAILVTQNYHLPRALFTCNALGLPAIGVAADQRTYHPRSYRLWQIREIPATLVAFWETGISHPLPVLGQPEPIFPNPSKHEVP